ncbi:DUF3592 domain-containing protein [Deinococcus enclensis]|uniref:DUF3592 domain-containing protein n=1 Tax=Deinococcus enclensis TaxID=1049582 RepID=A0ABT9MF61_9DEIO|nr:DUF3592 domain-containing protein [Deinococcus enclensis]MDP9765241.1 hypothetical protein [Deinococcus enclensis]
MANDAPVVIPLMLLMLLSGGALLTLLFRALFGSRHWHEADGVVTGTKTSTSDSEGRLPAYNAHIAFQYGVGPQTYDGEMAVPYFSARTARQVIETHPAGTAVKVYFNPKKPAQSVLRIKSPGIWMLWIVTALGVFGFFCIVMAAGSLLFE